MSTRRIGRFVMAGLMYRRMVDNGEGAAVFAGFIPLSIDHEPHRDRLIYTGMHEQFRPVDYGEIVPEYQVSLSAGEPFPTWIEVKR